MKKLIKKILATKLVLKYARAALELQDWFTISMTPQQSRVARLIRQVRMETRLGMDNFEAYQVYVAAKNTSRLRGAIAEVGVFEGGSARLIAEVRGNRKLYLFDTFEGLPAVEEIDKELFYEGQFRSNYERVSGLFADMKDVTVSKGVFPQETGHIIANEQFSFVHIDVDLYQATLDCLKFFYPRLLPGGVLLSHDYGSVVGVRKAFDEFLSDKPEFVLEPSRSQALIVKH